MTFLFLLSMECQLGQSLLVLCGSTMMTGMPTFFCPVFYEWLELVERPRAVDVHVASPNGCPHPYALELLHGSGGRVAFGFMHDLTGYYMAGIPCESALLPGELLQMTFC